MKLSLRYISIVAGCALLSGLTACNGILGGIYDEPNDQVKVAPGTLYVDASSWADWYYVDLDSLAALQAAGDSVGLHHAQTHFTRFPVPTTGDSGDGQTGIYTYWFDVFGQGISHNEKRSFTPTGRQQEPPSWTFAVHRDNVRTNGGAVLETNYNDLSQLPENSGDFLGATFTEDEWTENAVWVDQSQMLNELIGCQGIKANKVLSNWLRVDIPPMPPAFTHNKHVFILRLKNGLYAALQLENYIGADGKKCNLTIRYKYPY
ncbi:HmuY family protein [Alloprevotella tannerae]|uniref:HmuY family protein n=1 Tax=Alloprevotella tannerae TaxID=76122 RepID=UPI0025D00932|nr:HmuY family protein [Alloprevotella tannerae]